jgi:hypothetical protein
MADQRFVDWLRVELKRRGLSFSQAAKLIGETADTFKSWMLRNNMPERAGVRLLSELKLDLPGTPLKFTKRWDGRLSDEQATFAQRLREGDRLRTRLVREMDPLVSILPKILAAMKEGDFSISASATVTPLEFDSDADIQYVDAMANAIVNGGVFVYLWPTERYLEDFSKEWNFPYVPPHEELVKQLVSHRQRVVARLVETRSYKKRDAERLASSRIVYADASESPFWAAGFSLGLFHTVDFNQVVRRMTVRVPGRHKRALLQPPPEHSSDMFSARFTSFVIRALTTARSAKMRQQKGVTTDIPADVLESVIIALRKGEVYE